MKSIIKFLTEVATFALHVLLFYIAYKMVAPLIVACLIAVWYKYGSIKGYFLNSASSLDRWGNSEFRTLFNLTLIKSSSQYLFGNIFETISSVLGKIERASQVVLVNYRIYYWWKKYKVYRHRKFIKTDYTLIGIGLNRLLWVFERNHCIISIDDNISWDDRNDLGLVNMIENKNRKPKEANFYLKIWTNRFGVDVPLLLTEKEYAKINLRTNKNIEDWIND